MTGNDDGYAGDLDGEPVYMAKSMRVGVCLDGGSVGFDMCDENQETICHGHFGLKIAREFLAKFQEAIEELAQRQNPN